MLIVAGLYAIGRGVTKDNMKAYSWAYIVASANKVDEDRDGARQLMSLLMKRMTSDEIGRAVVAQGTGARLGPAAPASRPISNGPVDADQPAQRRLRLRHPRPRPVVVQQPAPAAVAAPAVTQPAPSSTFTRTTPAPVKNEKRTSPRADRPVPSGLRKRFGF